LETFCYETCQPVILLIFFFLFFVFMIVRFEETINEHIISIKLQPYDSRFSFWEKWELRFQGDKTSLSPTSLYFIILIANKLLNRMNISKTREHFWNVVIYWIVRKSLNITNSFETSQTIIWTVWTF
jgi:hypothetical protein